MRTRVPALRPNPRLANPIYERDAKSGKFIATRNVKAKDSNTVRGELLPRQNDQR